MMLNWRKLNRLMRRFDATAPIAPDVPMLCDEGEDSPMHQASPSVYRIYGELGKRFEAIRQEREIEDMYRMYGGEA